MLVVPLAAGLRQRMRPQRRLDHPRPAIEPLGGQPLAGLARPARIVLECVHAAVAAGGEQAGDQDGARPGAALHDLLTVGADACEDEL